MKILALEFSSPQRSVAIVRRDEFHESPSGLRQSPSFPNKSGAHGLHPSELIVSEVVENRSNSNAPLTMIEEVLRETKLEREQIECLAIGLGPGSYTGIRSAISIAQGWQLARQIKILGVSSAESIAAQAQADGLTGRVEVVIDAQREELYLAAYELTRDSYHEITPLKIVSLSEAQQRAEARSVFIGPEVSRWFASGKTVFPRASTLGRLALNRTDFIPCEKLEPIYLRETNFVKAPPPRVVP